MAKKCNCHKPCGKTICCSICNEATNCIHRCPKCAPKEKVKVEPNSNKKG